MSAYRNKEAVLYTWIVFYVSGIKYYLDLYCYLFNLVTVYICVIMDAGMFR